MSMQRTLGMRRWRRLFLFVPLLLLLLFPGCFSAGRDADRAALLRFKRSVSADSGGLLSRWSGADACSWPGVSCDARSRVVALNISGGGSCGAVFPCSDPAAGLAGQLSPAIGGLTELRVLHLPFHGFSGEVPGEIWGLPNLEVLDLEGSSLSGVLPPRFPPGLRVLNLASNRIRGEIPSSLSSCSDLEVVDLSRNQIEGAIPASFGGLPKLRELRLSSNRLRGSIPLEIGDGCRDLEQLDLSGNLLVHGIPGSLGNCGELRSLLLRSNLLEGGFPGEIGRLGKLQVLDVSRNRLRGFIPRELGSCLELAVLVLSNPYHRYPSGGNPGNIDGGESNYFHGGIPANITSLPKLRMLWAPRSTSGGPFPSNWGACESLEVVNLGQNLLTGKIPAVLEQCKNLKHLNLSSNMLQGQIPVGFGELKSLEYLLLSGNNLTGEIPVALGHLYSLKALDLSSNALFGGIPDDLVNLRNLSVLLLHNNNLSGNIPYGAVDFRSISVFDIPFNNLSGMIPLSASRVRADSTLGEPFPRRYHIISHSTSPSDTQRRSLNSPTPSTPPPGSSTSKGKHGFSSIEIASITSAAAILSVLLALIVIYVYSRKCVHRSAVQSSERREVTIFVDIGVPLTYETVVTATGGFNGSNCIGSGGFGATYKAEIAPGVLVAIKRLAVGRFQGLQQFHAEIKTLGRWRHPNLVTLIGYHISEAETFLIYNYLPGGNLEKFIKERSKRALDWRMLHKIALDVAQALAYLHDHCQPRILHRDVKPSNILLDNNFNAYLSDFGLARLLGNSETHVTTGVAGTFGYVAPEYAMTCRVSDKADVYSYGVVLLELISDKKALDPSFSQYGNGFNIVAWAAMLLRQGQAREFFTDGLWNVGPHGALVETLHLAVKCTDESLSVRPTMKQVVQRLKQLQPPTGR